jgi:dihydrofolate reductase
MNASTRPNVAGSRARPERETLSASARSSRRQRVLDELKLWIHPCFVGRGKSLFREGEKTKLKLIAQKTSALGVIVASYQPVTT